MRVISVIICAVLLFHAAKPYHAAAEEVFDSAEAYVLAEASTGAVLLEKNSDKQMDIGYLAKLMTLLIVAEDIQTGRYSLDTELTASQSVSGTKGAVIWLEPGDKMTVEELLKSAIIGNANDAVTVLAENSERSVENFVKRMNTEAFDLGLRDTAFLSPWGFYGEGSYSTAHDLAVICCRLSGFEFLRPYFKTWRDFVKSGATELVSENSLARTYERHIGFKACHYDEMYSVAEGGESDSGERYIAIVLNSPDSDSSLRSAKKLVERGFREFKVTATAFPDEMLMPLKVRCGCESAVEISLRRQQNLVIPSAVNELSTVVVMPQYLDAPVKYGQVVGSAAFYSEKELVCEIDIIAEKDVEELNFSFVARKMLAKLLE